MGMTGRELARAMGVTPEAMSRWEQGKATVGVISDRALRMLVALDPEVAGVVTRESIAGIEEGNGEPLRLVARMSDAGEWVIVSGIPATEPNPLAAGASDSVFPEGVAKTGAWVPEKGFVGARGATMNPLVNWGASAGVSKKGGAVRRKVGARGRTA
jgi:hypothetical protein